jgi:hypothetical protein
VAERFIATVLKTVGRMRVPRVRISPLPPLIDYNKMHKITVTNTIQAEISDAERKRIAMDFLYERFNWLPHYFIKEGFVREKISYYSSHSFQAENKVREATQEDHVISEIIQILNF